MKSDLQLQSDVADALRTGAHVSMHDIAVTAHDGVVTLAGAVPSLGERMTAARVAENVSGVVSVRNELLVRLPHDQRRSDADIASDAVRALSRDGGIPDSIKVRVQDRWLWLVGEADGERERSAAERAVERVPGIKGVTNLLRLRRRAGDL